jgi:hypothetical protein
MTAAELALAKLSRRQHGVWSRRQAISRGLTPRMIRTRVASGAWVVLDNGVYGHIAVPTTWERSVMAAVLAEPWAVASHRSAAVLHVLEGFRPGRPEITVRPGANARGRLAIVHRGVDVRTTTARGIPVVSLAQTFVDLAQVVSRTKVAAALAAKVDGDDRVLGAVRDRYCLLAPRGGRDLRGLRAVLDGFGAGPLPQRSELERRLAEVLAPMELPPLVWEAPFPGREATSERVDVLVPDWALVLEADGRAWHTRAQDFERDRRRDAEAAASGYLTLRFTWHQLQHEASWVRRILLRTGATRAAAVEGTEVLAPTDDAPNVRAA